MSNICIPCQSKTVTHDQVTKSEWFEGVCDVCRILSKKDTTLKQVKHCDSCNANICADCEPRFDKRMLAAIIRAFKLKTKSK